MNKEIIVDTRDVLLNGKKADVVVAEVNNIISEATEKYPEVKRDDITVQGEYYGEKLIVCFERYATDEEIKEREERREKIRQAVKIDETGVLIDFT